MALQLPEPNRTTRFAPSPTGHLHLGHVASALCVHGFARALALRALVRSEDHDRGRSRPAYEDAIFADLDWLQIPYENREAAAAHPSAFRQSDNLTRYAAALGTLATQGLIYGCDCTRKRLSGLAPAGDDPEADGQQELVYDGHCRARGLDWRKHDVGVRLRLPEEAVLFHDAFLGDVAQTPARQCGDVLLRDRHGNFTYQLAVVVDDAAQDVGVVIRGQDLLASTGRQILLGRALGRATPPVFAHHPLLVDEAGRKLGKRFFSASITERRTRGDAPAALIGEAMARFGLAPEGSRMTAEDAARLIALPPKAPP